MAEKPKEKKKIPRSNVVVPEVTLRLAGLSKNRSPVRQAWQAIRHEIRVYMGPVVRRNASTREVGNDISKRVVS